VASREINSTWLSNAYNQISGTSMATPHVSGSIAIINQYLTMTSRTRTPKQIEIILNNTGKIVRDIGYSEINFSRIDIYKALISLDVDSPNVTLLYPVNNALNQSTSVSFIANVTDLRISNATLYLWNSSDSIINQSFMGFSESKGLLEFNVSLQVSGNYKWNFLVYDQNSNSAFSSANFSLFIGNMSSILSSPENNSFTRQDNTNFTCSVETNRAFLLKNTTFFIWNLTSLVYNETRIISGYSNSTVFNYSLEYEGIYYWNCFSEDNASHSSFANSNNSLTYDLSSPSIALISPDNSASYSSNSQSLTFGYNISDNFEIGNCSLIVNGLVNITNSSITNLSANHYFVQTFSPASYVWSINCTDKAGNIANSSNRSFMVNAPSPSSGGAGGGGSSTEKTTKTLSSSQLVSGSSQQLASGEEIDFVLPSVAGGSVESPGASAGSTTSSGSHSITVNALSSNYANITLRSSPINLIIRVDEEKKFNLSSNNYYDFYIKLNSIQNNKANLTMKSIYELIKVNSVNLTRNETLPVNSSISGDFEDGTDNAKIYRYVFIGIIIFVVIIALLISWYLRKKPEKISRKKKK